MHSFTLSIHQRQLHQKGHNCMLPASPPAWMATERADKKSVFDRFRKSAPTPFTGIPGDSAKNPDLEACFLRLTFASPGETPPGNRCPAAKDASMSRFLAKSGRPAVPLPGAEPSEWQTREEEGGRGPPSSRVRETYGRWSAPDGPSPPAGADGSVRSPGSRRAGRGRPRGRAPRGRAPGPRNRPCRGYPSCGRTARRRRRRW